VRTPLVNVHRLDGTVIACGVLARNRHHGHDKHGTVKERGPNPRVHD
jgi:hypothetical protein